MSVKIVLPPPQRDLRSHLFSWPRQLGHVPGACFQHRSGLVFVPQLRLQRRRRPVRVHFRLYVGAGVRAKDARARLRFRNHAAVQAGLANLCRPHPAVRVLSGVRPVPVRQVQRFRLHPSVQCRSPAHRSGRDADAGPDAAIQTAESGRAAALRRPDGRLSAGSLADAPVPQLGHAGIGAALFRRPAVRLEPALLSGRCLVFQPVRLAGCFSCWARGWRWAGPIRCTS